MIGSRYSFKFLSKANIVTTYPDSSPKTVEPQNTSSAEIDNKKRAFLKLAGVVGVGALATTLLPKKASALVFGSAPTATSMGVKNASGTKINPATEDTLVGIKGKTNLLSFDNGSNPGNLNVNIAAGGVQLRNAGGTIVNPATQETLSAINAITSQMTFSNGSLNTSVGGTGNIVGLKDTTNAQINPATDDSLVYLRRIVKLMESQGTIDSQQRQRVIVDGFGAVIYGTTGTAPYSGGSGVGVPRVTVANDSVINAVITTLAGWDSRMFGDPARTAY